jgi:hypothetical protein
MKIVTDADENVTLPTYSSQVSALVHAIGLF